MITIYNATLRPDVFYHKLNIFLLIRDLKCPELDQLVQNQIIL